MSTWRFPNVKKCPYRNCAIQFKCRSLAIKHYKSNHASTCVLCFLCKKPISVKKGSGGSSNYRKHFRLIHPHVKMTLSQHPKTEPSTQGIQKIAQPSQKHFVEKKRCKICGMQFTNLSRHIMEVHTKKRILCPLISCDFKSKRLEQIRRHWKSAHQNFRFPEIAQNSGFTYKTTTEECVNISIFLFCLKIDHC